SGWAGGVEMGWQMPAEPRRSWSSIHKVESSTFKPEGGYCQSYSHSEGGFPLPFLSFLCCFLDCRVSFPCSTSLAPQRGATARTRVILLNSFLYLVYVYHFTISFLYSLHRHS